MTAHADQAPREEIHVEVNPANNRALEDPEFVAKSQIELAQITKQQLDNVPNGMSAQKQLETAQFAAATEHSARLALRGASVSKIEDGANFNYRGYRIMLHPNPSMGLGDVAVRGSSLEEAVRKLL